MDAREPAPVIVGVVYDQPDAVVLGAVDFARRFGAELVCASVDRGRYTVQEREDGSVASLPIDPDLPDLSVEAFPEELQRHLATLLGGRGVRWSTRILAGDPAHALGRLADRLDAAMIVVGTREAGLRGSIQELLTGSVAAHLAHRQHRPVVVIPLDPVPVDRELPWEQG